MADANARRTRSIIVLINGTTLTGDVICGPSGRLESVVFDPNIFIEFQPDGRNMQFLAKSQILSVEADRTARREAA
jgi:hypothetical protein